MDSTDINILNLLQKDSRATLRSLGQAVSLSPPAVADRIEKMKKRGIIDRYTIEINRDKMDYHVIGYILAAPRPEKYNAFCEFCEKSPTIVEHHHLTGEFNAMLRFAAANTHELDKLLDQLKTYGDTRTSIELKMYFDRKEIPLQQA